MLDVARPQDDRNRESEAQPKLVAKHGDGVSRVMVVTCGGSRHILNDLRINRLVIVVRYVVHFEILESAPRCDARYHNIIDLMSRPVAPFGSGGLGVAICGVPFPS
jgi:hypothetical protein